MGSWVGGARKEDRVRRLIDYRRLKVEIFQRRWVGNMSNSAGRGGLWAECVCLAVEGAVE